MKYLDPKADLTFKKIFGNHPKRLISLLNALLPLSEEEQIHEILAFQRESGVLRAVRARPLLQRGRQAG